MNVLSRIWDLGYKLKQADAALGARLSDIHYAVHLNQGVLTPASTQHLRDLLSTVRSHTTSCKEEVLLYQSFLRTTYMHAQHEGGMSYVEQRWCARNYVHMKYAYDRWLLLDDVLHDFQAFVKGLP